MARSNSGATLIRSILRAPAVKAVLIQLSSFAIVLSVARGLLLLTGLGLTIAAAALLQGAIAAGASRLCKLASWWLFIQAAFPLAVLVMLWFRLPPGIFLAAFIALLALYWSTFRTQVPFYPSSPPVWEAVSGLLPAGRPIRFVDIGSGFGGLVLHLSRQRGDSDFAGIELAPLPWAVSVLRNQLKRGKARFIRGDYDRLDFASFDVVFAYLSPAAMPALWQKAQAEMRSGSLLLSYEFDIPGVQPQLVSAPVKGGPALYGWTI